MSDLRDSTRREFLIAAGTSVAAGAMLVSASALGEGPGKAEDIETQGAIEQIPPHRELATPGVHVYVDKPSYRAGRVGEW